MRLNTQTCKMWFCFAAPLPLGMSPHVALQDLFESHENFAKQSLIHDDFCGALLCCIFGHGSLRWTVLWRKLDRTRHRSFCFRVRPQSGLWTKEYYEIVLNGPILSKPIHPPFPPHRYSILFTTVLIFHHPYHQRFMNPVCSVFSMCICSKNIESKRK